MEVRRVVCELALARQPDWVEADYRRSELYGQRRALMPEWADYVAQVGLRTGLNPKSLALSKTTWKENLPSPSLNCMDQYRNALDCSRFRLRG